MERGDGCDTMSHAHTDMPSKHDDVAETRAFSHSSYHKHHVVTHSPTLRRTREIAKSYQARHNKAVEARFSGACHRNEVDYRYSNVRNTIVCLQEQVQSLVESLGSSKTTKSLKQHKIKVESIAFNMHTSVGQLSEQLANVDLALLEAREAERKLTRAEEAERNAVRAMFTAFHGNELLSSDEAWSDVTLLSEFDEKSEVSDHASAQIPLQLNAYLDAKATLRIMRERVLDLHMEFQEQSERRDLLADQGQPLEQNDAEFASMQSSMLQSAKKDFAEAAIAVADARKLCAEDGVEIPSSSDLDSMTDEDQHKDSLREQENAVTTSSSRRITAQQRIGDPFESSSHIIEPVLSSAASSSQSLQEFRSQAFERVSHWMERVMGGAVDHSAVNHTLPLGNSNIAGPYLPWPGTLTHTSPLRTRSLP